MHCPMRASARPSTHTQTHTRARTHANTDHFLWMGKGSYWRILSGKRTFSNKWWWTLDEKTIVSSSFLSQFAITSVHFTLVLSSFPGWKGVDIQVPRNRTPSPTSGRHNQALTAFLTLNRNRFLYMWGVFCLLVFVCLGLGAFVYRLGFVPHYMEDHSCQKKRKTSEILGVFFKASDW